MGAKIILTGATGMVGEGVLHECLLHPQVSKILVVGRKPCGVSHEKVEEIILNDFFDLSHVKDRFSGYDGCLFCLGVSAIGLTEEQYEKITYSLTLNFARTLASQNPGMTFCYISGSGTDSTEKGRMMWARVKGKTENDLKKLPFKNVYLFRPGFMLPTPGMKNTLKFYKYISWLYPVMKLVTPKFVSTLKELGLAMINAVVKGYDKNIVEVPDIIKLSKK